MYTHTAADLEESESSSETSVDKIMDTDPPVELTNQNAESSPVSQPEDLKTKVTESTNQIAVSAQLAYEAAIQVLDYLEGMQSRLFTANLHAEVGSVWFYCLQ